MKPSKVVDQFVAAWKDGVHTDYQQGVISSERGLQASIYHHLRPRLQPDYNVLVEPKVQYHNDSPYRIPDMVIAKSSNGDRHDGIVSIVELKFFPTWRPVKKDVAPDINRLISLYDLGKNEKLSIEIDPNTGDFENSQTVGEDAVLIFGIVGQDLPFRAERYIKRQKEDSGSNVSILLVYGNVAPGEHSEFFHKWIS